MESILLLLFILLVLIISAPAIKNLFFYRIPSHPMTRFLHILEESFHHTPRA